MKTILTTIALLATLTVSAQISLEHTYQNGNVGILSWGETGYHTFNSDLSTWKHYNANHQLEQTIIIPSIPDYTLVGQPSYYGGMFSASGSFHYLVMYLNASTGSRIIRIYDENNTQEFHKECSGCVAVLSPVNDQTKMLIYNTEWSEVYSLPGDWPFSSVDVTEVGSSGGSFSMFPNPAESMLTVELQEASHVTILNMNGQTIATYPNLGSGTTQIPVNGLTSGTYLINVNGQFSERLIVR